MNQIFTKSSAEAKISSSEQDIFAKVCEKGINDFTEKNQEYTNDFQLSSDQEDFYRLKKFRSVRKMEFNYFTKQAICDRFVMKVEHLKQKSFIKCYQNNELVLEIAASKSQINAIEDKYYYHLKRDDGKSNDKYQLFYAGTFMYKDKNTPYLSSKLIDLRLIKLVKLTGRK